MVWKCFHQSLWRFSLKKKKVKLLIRHLSFTFPFPKLLSMSDLIQSRSLHAKISILRKFFYKSLPYKHTHTHTQTVKSGWATTTRKKKPNRNCKGLIKLAIKSKAATLQKRLWRKNRKQKWQIGGNTYNIKQYIYGTPLRYSCLENPMDGGAW